MFQHSTTDSLKLLAFAAFTKLPIDDPPKEAQRQDDEDIRKNQTLQQDKKPEPENDKNRRFVIF